jgi:site-specific recombinase XerD
MSAPRASRSTWPATRNAKLTNVLPHVLRHTSAKLRRRAGATIDDVQALLGHRPMATTARYLHRLEGDDDDGWAGVEALPGWAGRP